MERKRRPNPDPTGAEAVKTPSELGSVSQVWWATRKHELQHHLSSFSTRVQLAHETELKHLSLREEPRVLQLVGHPQQKFPSLPSRIHTAQVPPGACGRGRSHAYP